MTRNEEYLRPQYKRILAYLRRHGKITPAQAFHDLGISKLSTRIGELIELGYPIVKIELPTSIVLEMILYGAGGNPLYFSSLIESKAKSFVLSEIRTFALYSSGVPFIFNTTFMLSAPSIT